MKKHYYLFGEQECSTYNESGFSELFFEIKQGTLNGNIYCYDENTPASKVLSDFDGFGDYVEITEAEYRIIEAGSYSVALAERMKELISEIQKEIDVMPHTGDTEETSQKMCLMNALNNFEHVVNGIEETDFEY